MIEYKFTTNTYAPLYIFLNRLRSTSMLNFVEVSTCTDENRDFLWNLC